MAIAFHRVNCAPLRDLDAAAPAGVVVGIIGENGSGSDQLLRLAAGLELPQSGKVEATAVLALDHTFARQDAVERERASSALDRLRRSGKTILLASHEEDLLERLSDEIWWLHEGVLAGRGDPREILAGYRRHVAARVRAWGEANSASLMPRMRRGDGRAEILGIETIGESGRPTMVWHSGELAVIKVRVRFREPVTNPVVGIMIRTRIGLNVYGTNTELEKLQLGPRAKGDESGITFAFRCELCPGEYTLTAASHDPDGVWHDWLEDAVAFSVSDTRYTAGVANLRAQVSLA
jgi:lipopolysaccharide transport system ATP-binding protein